MDAAHGQLGHRRPQHVVQGQERRRRRHVYREPRAEWQQQPLPRPRRNSGGRPRRNQPQTRMSPATRRDSDDTADDAVRGPRQSAGRRHHGGAARPRVRRLVRDDQDENGAGETLRHNDRRRPGTRETTVFYLHVKTGTSCIASLEQFSNALSLIFTWN